MVSSKNLDNGNQFTGSKSAVNLPRLDDCLTKENPSVRAMGSDLTETGRA